jgi:hypothetical protein
MNADAPLLYFFLPQTSMLGLGDFPWPCSVRASHES